MTRARLLLILAATATATAFHARADVGPAGGEFQVNSYTTGNQFNPAVSVTPGGNFVVVWTSGSYYGASEDGSREGVVARRFDAAGTPQGPGFIVPTYRTGPQSLAAVASDPLGNFVVTWQGGNYQFQQDGSVSGVFLQRFDGSGAPQGVETRVNTVTRGPQNSPSIASDSAGNFVVVWQGGSSYYNFQQDGSASGIFAQRFDANGSALGPEFQVNSYTTGFQSLPVVSVEPLGGFVVAWQGGSYSFNQDGDETGIFARRFDASGTPLGLDFQVNTYTTGQQVSPAIASDADGNFVVAWQSGYYYTGPDGSRSGVFARQFDATGVPLAAEFQVNTYTTGDQRRPHVTADASGNFVVVWDSRGNYPFFQDGSREGVFGQHFAPSGVPIGSEFQVNTYTTNGQNSARIAATPSGEFVVAWTSGAYYTGQDGSNAGVFAQRMQTTAFFPPAPVAGNKLVLRDGPTDPRKKSVSARCDDGAIDLGDGRGSIDDPTLSGGRLRIRSGTFENVYQLPVAQWRASGIGPSLAYTYRDSALLQGPVKAVRIRRGRFKVTARGAQLGHSLATNPDPVVVMLQIGDRGRRYCAEYGGTIEFKPDVVYRGRRAPAPSICPR